MPRRVSLGLVLLLLFLSAPRGGYAEIWVPDDQLWLSVTTRMAVDGSYALAMNTGGAGPYLLVCVSGSAAVLCPMGSTTSIVGITVGDLTSIGDSYVALTGNVPCTFDGAFTAGHYVQLSATVDGNCTDAGTTYPTNGKVIVGTAVETSGIAAIGTITLFGRGVMARPAITTVALASDATANATTTGVKITGLDTATGTGTFTFQYWVRYQSSATGTGVTFGVNHTGTVTRIIAQTRMVGAAGAATQAVTTPPVALSGSATRAMSTTAPNLGPSVSVGSASADMLMVIEGLITITATGNLELWHASETAASTQVMADSSLILTRTQ